MCRSIDAEDLKVVSMTFRAFAGHRVDDLAQGIQSPPDPADSLMIITLGPCMEALGDLKSLV